MIILYLNLEMDRMEKLRIAAMIPESISEISYANEESDNTTLYNMGQNKTTERNEDYFIKINAPDNTEQQN